MGRTKKVWALLQHGPDPTARSYLIERIGPAGVDVKVMTDRLTQEQDAFVRRAIVLSLGQFDRDHLLLGGREPLVSRLLGMYQDDPDAGVHSAVEWLLRQWGEAEKVEKIDRELATGHAAGERQWYVNRQGQTMIIVPPAGEVTVGEAVGEGNEQYKERLDWSFAIAAKDVTVEQFLQCPQFNNHHFFKVIAPTVDCPVHSVSWYNAAAYCNWLTQQELPKDQWDSQCCYLPNADGKYAKGMTIASDWRRRTGYRLPSDAEWEFACRAGSVTEWSFGSAEELLAKYAWYANNSLSRSHAGGTLKPNDLGLFDMHGNVWQWCQTGEHIEPDKEKGIQDKDSRRTRGGSYDIQAWYARSYVRNMVSPGYANSDFGFRLVRTLPLNSFTPLPSPPKADGK